ncbi:MAG: hypothetical protein AAFY72_08505, partial [Cyanobacteria bacterium J06649_4]
MAGEKQHLWKDLRYRQRFNSQVVCLCPCRMARDIRINYLYASEATWQRFDLTCDYFGWANKSFVQQCIQDFFDSHRAYYVEAALKEIDARQVEETTYYQVLRDASEDALPRYQKGRPGFGITPLDDFPFVEAEQTIKRRYNVITLGNDSAVLLKVARIVDTGPMVQLVSRILEQH